MKKFTTFEILRIQEMVFHTVNYPNFYPRWHRPQADSSSQIVKIGPYPKVLGVGHEKIVWG